MTSFRAPENFNWPLAYEAEAHLVRLVEGFLDRNATARRLAERMRSEAGTDILEWTDHLVVSAEHEPALRSAGFEAEAVDAPVDHTVFAHPHAMLPRVLVSVKAPPSDAAAVLAIRAESIADFMARNGVAGEPTGAPGARYRIVPVALENGAHLFAIERLASRGFLVAEPRPGFADALLKVRELWRTRCRNPGDDAEAVAEAFAVQERCIALVGPDVACELFFAEEREYWMFRNRAGRIQKRRQDQLGLGWANHDHHTFRSSRRFFADLIAFLARFGFAKRERYYAGAEAGWGAQICEHPVTGITVFADVDLAPEETEIDFSTQRLPEATRLGTVGLWCALHGDSFLQAGMHHLEARFDFPVLREQLAAEGIATMRPFSDFPFLKQAFTEGERWPVAPERVESLVRRGLVTRAQADAFLREGAIGSHLENLQRKGGFKGFNQKSVSVIIAATDPRVQRASPSH